LSCPVRSALVAVDGRVGVGYFADEHVLENVLFSQEKCYINLVEEVLTQAVWAAKLSALPKAFNMAETSMRSSMIDFIVATQGDLRSWYDGNK
jgi:hypothetical protein